MRPAAVFSRIGAPENLHDRVVRLLALRILEAEQGAETLVLPNEADLCHELGVSRTVIREAVKVLADKGMVEVKPRSGTRALPRTKWNLLDPDILGWHALLRPDPRFLRELCEVRLGIEPVVSGFAAVRASDAEIATIGRCLEQRAAWPSKGKPDDVVDLDLRFHAAVVAACHNALLDRLSATIRTPFRIALSYTTRVPAAATLDLTAYGKLFDAISQRDAEGARAAAAAAVGLAMLAVEEVIRSKAFQQETRRHRAGPSSDTGGSR